jgi:hypothetical protein
MLSVVAVSGFWTPTLGLVFTYGILMPAIATSLIVVAKVTGRGEKRVDDEVRGRWLHRRGTD